MLRPGRSRRLLLAWRAISGRSPPARRYGCDPVPAVEGMSHELFAPGTAGASFGSAREIILADSPVRVKWP